jgi:hypothetical protein
MPSSGWCLPAAAGGRGGRQGPARDQLLEIRCVTPSDRQELSLDNHSAACRPLRENFLYTTPSRPALRAAACGGRPRAGNDTAVTRNRPGPLMVSLAQPSRFRTGDRGSGEVGVFLVPFPAAAQDRDAEEVQHRGTGVDQQAYGGDGRRDQDGEQVDEPREYRQRQPGAALAVIEPLPQQVRPALAYHQIITRMTAIATSTRP